MASYLNRRYLSVWTTIDDCVLLSYFPLFMMYRAIAFVYNTLADVPIANTRL